MSDLGVQSAVCRRCKRLGFHIHIHELRDGVPGTHRAGSERFRCHSCGNIVWSNGPRPRGLRFELDR